jgi:hypothetical protein
MKQIPGESKLFLTGFMVSGLALSVVAFLTDIPSGWCRQLRPLNISRWAFRYPHLFLDHWGKPLFTILSAHLLKSVWWGYVCLT